MKTPKDHAMYRETTRKQSKQSQTTILPSNKAQKKHEDTKGTSKRLRNQKNTKQTITRNKANTNHEDTKGTSNTSRNH